jgi:hypothetical protein
LTGFSRLLEPPRLRTAGRGIQDGRRATWLELFFDLVFVAAVGRLANSLGSCSAAALALLLVPLALSSLTVVLILAGVLVAQVVYELASHERHTETAGI